MFFFNSTNLFNFMQTIETERYKFLAHFLGFYQSSVQMQPRKIDYLAWSDWIVVVYRSMLHSLFENLYIIPINAVSRVQRLFGGGVHKCFYFQVRFIRGRRLLKGGI